MKKPHISSALERFYIIQPHIEQGVFLSQIVNFHPVGLSTLKTWVRLYRENGLKGLERKERLDKGTRKEISSELEKLVEALVLKTPPISLAAIHRKAEEIAKDKEWKIPTYRIVRDIAKKIDPALIFLAHQGNKAYEQEYELIYRREASQPNQVWQADQYPLGYCSPR